MRILLISTMVALGTISAVTVNRSALTIPFTFTNGTVADADQVNANFTAIETAVNDNDSRIVMLEATSLESPLSADLDFSGNHALNMRAHNAATQPAVDLRAVWARH